MIVNQIELNRREFHRLASAGFGGLLVGGAGLGSSSHAAAINKNVIIDPLRWAWDQELAGITCHVRKNELHPWSGWCTKFVANAFGSRAAGPESAIDLWKQLKDRNQGKPDEEDEGALVFWSWKDQGHVGIHTGKGKVVHTGGWPPDKPIRMDDLDDVAKHIHGATYLGYGPAPWPVCTISPGGARTDFGNVAIGGRARDDILIVNDASVFDRANKPVTVRVRLAPTFPFTVNAITQEIEPKREARTDTKCGPFTLIQAEGLTEKGNAPREKPPGGLPVEDITLVPGAAAQIVVWFEPTVAAQYSAEVHFLVEISNGNDQWTSVSETKLLGTGVGKGQKPDAELDQRNRGPIVPAPRRPRGSPGQ